MQASTAMEIDDFMIPVAGKDNLPTKDDCAINVLPRELLLKIFKICHDLQKVDLTLRSSIHSRRWGFGIPKDKSPWLNSGWEKPRPLAFELLASRVCRLWRNSIISDPSFWTLLDFDEPKPFVRTQAYISRSQESPLDIIMSIFHPPSPIMTGYTSSINYAFHEEAIAKIPSNLRIALDLILPHVHRWNSLKVIAMRNSYMHEVFLRLCALSSAPLFQQLSLKAKNNPSGKRKIIIPFTTDTTILVTFQLSHVDLERQGPLGMFQNLQSLILKGCGPMDVPVSFTAFHQMLGGLGSTSIEELVMDDVFLEQPEESTLSSKIMMPTLRTLSLGVMYLKAAVVFLNLVNAPAVRELHLKCFGSADLDLFNTQISRGLFRPLNEAGDTILSSVETIWLACKPFDKPMTTIMLGQLRRLKKLTLDVNDRPWSEDIRVSLLEGHGAEQTGSTAHVFCPQLEKLSVFGYQFEKESELADFVKARIAMGCPLKVMKFRECDMTSVGHDEREFLKQNLEELFIKESSFE